MSGEAKRFAQPCLGDSEEFLEIFFFFKFVRLECEYWWARQCQICHAVYEIEQPNIFHISVDNQ